MPHTSVGSQWPPRRYASRTNRSAKTATPISGARNDMLSVIVPWRNLARTFRGRPMRSHRRPTLRPTVFGVARVWVWPDLRQLALLAELPGGGAVGIVGHVAIEDRSRDAADRVARGARKS